MASTPGPDTLRQITDDLVVALGWLALLTRHPGLSADARELVQEALAAVERASARLLELPPSTGTS